MSHPTSGSRAVRETTCPQGHGRGGLTAKAGSIRYSLNPPVCHLELNVLFRAAWPRHTTRDVSPVLAHGLGYVCAHAGDELIGFVNVAWDGDKHAFLLDPTVHPDWQRQGIGTKLVRRAADLARSKSVEWLHVDYEPRLAAFYRQCGFRETAAGLMNLKRTQRPSTRGRQAAQDNSLGD